jgi:hypothetical protein
MSRRHHPARRTARGRWRPKLHLPALAALYATNGERHAPPAVARGDEVTQVEYSPAGTVGAVSVEFVTPLEKTGDAA